MALHCSNCGAENLETAQLCYSCGDPIEGTGPDELIEAGDVLVALGPVNALDGIEKATQ